MGLHPGGDGGWRDPPAPVIVRDTAKKRAVCSLLECILVYLFIFRKPEKRIEWRDIWDLSRIVHIYTPPKINYPGAITASPDGFLGYIDAGVCHGEVVWVDCKTSPPGPSPPVQIGGHHIMHTGICCEERDVTLTTYWDFSHTVGLYAYDTKTCTELWEVSWKKDDKVAASPEKNENFMDEDSVETENLEKALSLAVDGHGHAFVCDVSKSWVKLYSCRDGSDLGCVIKKGQHGIGNPLLLSWNSTIPSLIVVHKKNNKNVLSVLKVKYN